MRDRLERVIFFDFIIFLEDMRLDFIIPGERVGLIISDLPEDCDMPPLIERPI